MTSELRAFNTLSIAAISLALGFGSGLVCVKNTFEKREINDRQDRRATLEDFDGDGQQDIVITYQEKPIEVYFAREGKYVPSEVVAENERKQLLEEYKRNSDELESKFKDKYNLK